MRFKLTQALLAAENIEGWMDREELVWLGKRAAEAESIVEVGTFKGRTAKMLALMTPGRVTCVDNFVGTAAATVSQEDWQANREPNTHLIAMPSVDASHWFHDTADFIFIDGDHDAPAPAQDIEAWLPHLKRGGILAGHDKWEPGVAEAIDALDVLDGPGQIWWTQV